MAELENPDPVTRWLKHAAKFVELAVEAQADRVTMIGDLQRAAECVKFAKILRRPYDEAQRRFRRQPGDGGEAA